MSPEEEQKELEKGAAEPSGREPAGEGKSKNYWWLSLGLILLLLGGGGYYALTGMRQAAQKLAGGSDYDQLSANSSVYDGGAGGVKNADYFPLDEEAARRETVEGAGVSRINPALARTRAELVADVSGAQVSRAAAPDAEEEPSSAEPRGAAPGAQAAMGEKLQARASLLGRPTGPAGSKSSASGDVGAFQGSGAAAGRASEQRETKKSSPQKAGRGSVMESLKGAFKATFYGARLSSHDAAKSWIARSFDGSAEATTAIEYEENMRTKLDKVNPDSIPNFLREQDVNSAEAKRLAVSEVDKPSMDKEATKEALAGDKEYQKKKLANDFSSSMINGLFAGISGTGSPAGGGGGGGEDGASLFSNPEDEQSFLDQELQDYIQQNGFGGECDSGCTMESPCCCLPGDGGAGVTDGLWAGPDGGDFPTGGDGLMWA